MQAQLALGRFHVVTHEACFVRGQAIENQPHRLLAPMHQLAQQLNKQFALQSTDIGAEPKLSARPHRRGGRDRLALPGPMNNRRLAAQSPGLAMHGVSAKTRFVPKQNLRAIAFSLAGKRRIRLLLLRIVRRPPARAQRCGVANEGSGGRRTILKGGNRGAELSRVRNDAGLWGFERAGCRVQ